MDPHTYVLARITPCIECTNLTASCQCILCCDYFCTSCFTTVHKGSKSKHEWIYVIQPHNISADTNIASFSSNYVTLPSPTTIITAASTGTEPHVKSSSSSLSSFSSSHTSETSYGVVPLPLSSRRSSHASITQNSKAGSRRSSWQQAEIQENEGIESFSIQTLGKYVRRASAMGNGTAPFITMKQGSLKVLTMDEARNEVVQTYTEEQVYSQQQQPQPELTGSAAASSRIRTPSDHNAASLLTVNDSETVGKSAGSRRSSVAVAANS